MSNTPDGAHLSEADAIRGGLYTPDGEKVRIPVIEDVQFSGCRNVDDSYERYDVNDEESR
ncbi:unknown protein [Paenibacillus amylolyticus]|uniref:Uncharacterized protein n=1 Tax=Paenibacillus amylolyticus TaxID=1451 RepID=A0A100VNH0_PAEAM|nr:unknown protein [Paenibacillus amylolyticus]